MSDQKNGRSGSAMSARRAALLALLSPELGSGGVPNVANGARVLEDVDERISSRRAAETGNQTIQRGELAGGLLKRDARLRRTGPETADFWEALAGLSITGASVWYVMSFSPPFVPIIWTIHRHEWQALLDDLDQARLDFTTAFHAAHAEWTNDEQSFQVLEPIPLHFQDLLP